MIPTENSLTIIALCSQIAQPEVAPLTTRQWSKLAQKIHASGLEPADLRHQDAASLLELSDGDERETERITTLLQRADSLTIELERLLSLGIDVLTRADPHYPARYKQRLKDAAPAVLFFAGDRDLLGQPGIAIVGSRNLDDLGRQAAEFVGNACGLSGLVLYSGGARGVDILSMSAALQARGNAVGILADSLEKAIRNPDYRIYLAQRELCLATPYSPSAPFSVGAAMGRNRLIYALADYAIVIASDFAKGGTWAGATEALKAQWLPVFALQHEQMPLGNQKLIGRGAIPFPYPFEGHYSELETWLRSHSSVVDDDSEQLSLF